MDKETKRNLSLIIFVVISLYSLLTNYWIMWAVITLMLFIDSVVDSLKEWFEKRQDLEITAKKTLYSPPSDHIEKITSIEQSISRIEQRLDVIEKKSNR